MATRAPVHKTRKGAVVRTTGFKLRRTNLGAVFVESGGQCYPFESEAEFLGYMAEELNRLRAVCNRKTRRMT